MTCPQCTSTVTTQPDENGDVTCLNCGHVFDQDEGFGLNSLLEDTLIMELRAKLQKIQGLIRHTFNDHREELHSRLQSAAALATQGEELLDDIETGISDIITDLQGL